ncbi:MAG: cyclic pyranopterin monophosphate synthase MoaC [Candidatus Kapabacteria bacterium]|nr:cyclic pyranopterin monophosphate synthase MoaC [Candidatus Kapabacteria bacterium]
MEMSHTDSQGKAKMVDVSEKNIVHRTAKAQGKVFLNSEAYLSLKNNDLKKGDALAVAKIGAIQAAKNTSGLIPLCHNIPINQVDLSFDLNDDENSVTINSFAITDAKTGIEMEALVAVSLAGLIIYDMCKAIDKKIRITDIRLIEKTKI